MQMDAVWSARGGGLDADMGGSARTVTVAYLFRNF